jgi:alkylation response protein AidB-like acyl-CoA dehydrogenase
MLTTGVLAKEMTPAHEDLRVRAMAYFSPRNLSAWRLSSDGYIRKETWEEFGKHGFLGVSLSRRLGGHGLGTLGGLIINEALSQLEDAGLTLGMHVQNEIACYWLASSKDASLRERFLPGLLNGQLVGCTCDTDPSGQMESMAIRQNGELVLQARKAYVVNGANADLCFVSVLLEGKLATVLVEKDRPGVRVAKTYDKFGTRAIDSVLIEFDGVRVPENHVVSQRGLQQLLHWNMVMTRARFFIAADAYLIHRALLAHILDYGARRRIGDRALASWPINRHSLARARCDLELMEAGLADGYQRLEAKAGGVPEIAALKWFCVERATDLAALCCDLEGGAGYMLDSHALQAYAQLRGLRMAGGSQVTMLTIANGSLACRAQLPIPSRDRTGGTRA